MDLFKESWLGLVLIRSLSHNQQENDKFFVACPINQCSLHRTVFILTTMMSRMPRATSRLKRSALSTVDGSCLCYKLNCWLQSMASIDGFNRWFQSMTSLDGLPLGVRNRGYV